MFYIIHGNNITQSLLKRAALLSKLREKQPGAYARVLEVSALHGDWLDDLTSQSDLFEPRSIYMIDGALIERTTRDVIANKVEEVASSPNIFIFFERDTLPSAVMTTLAERAVKVYVSLDTASAVRGRDSGLFHLADLFGRRARRDLWVEFTKACEIGRSAEEIHGILLWQVKSIILAQGAPGPKEASLSPFVYSKSKKYASAWPDAEIKLFLAKLVSAYHDSRRGLRDLGLSLERIILRI